MADISKTVTVKVMKLGHYHVALRPFQSMQIKMALKQGQGHGANIKIMIKNRKYTGRLR